MKTLASNIYEGRYVLKNMLLKDLKARYTGSVLGPLWTFIPPVYQMLLYTFLFGMLLKVRFEEGGGALSFVIHLLAGLIPWLFFQESTQRGVNSFIEHSHIIKNVKFPVEVCVFVSVLSSMTTFLINMAFYCLLLIFEGRLDPSSAVWIFLPLSIQLLMTLGLSLGLGSIAVFFRDIAQAVGMVFNLIFFLTPIMYPASIIPERLRWVFTINPFYNLTEIYRGILVKGTVAPPETFLYPLSAAIVFSLGGYYIFLKTKDAFKDIL
jgi:lipopolysaccharide transport system permease protein